MKSFRGARPGGRESAGPHQKVEIMPGTDLDTLLPALYVEVHDASKTPAGPHAAPPGRYQRSFWSR
ncbi:hypothetical protein FRACA_330007 [Frankia canadensis]|uniref:Uncharacterized protein n=1 Tax=Frankia canadensis TaxID=1836972 RepID=A0A2I2KUQ9_9ACTN|nr:hypothetical protein FRACA_330007 [Frankia canadensis]SOU56694.1 hypothetical protein FRACA_330007 [Frankia canadensis]